MTGLSSLALLVGWALLPAQGGVAERPATGPGGDSIVEAGAGSLMGVVRTSQGDRPLAYARVQVVDDSIADWTDDAGAYRIEGLDPGQWQLRVIHPGHDPLDVTVFVPGDRIIRLDLTLEARPGPAVDALAEFQPFQVEYTLPALLNPLSVSALMQRLYPPDLARLRVGGEAVLRLWLDERGRVVRRRISSTSGHGALDSIALTVADSMRFRPARNRQDPVMVIVRIPVMFTVPEPPPGADAVR